MHLAEFNLGILKHDWDDPRIADFQNNLDRVYAIAERSPGYVWHMPGDEMEAAQLDPNGPLGGNPRIASTLSVWESPEALRGFSFDTVHRVFYDRRAEWYDPAVQPKPRFVMWWVAQGHRPDVKEAVARRDHLARHGPSPSAFGWQDVETFGHTG